VKNLTLEQVDDICWMHNYMNAMPPEYRPYFKWWITEITNGTIKVLKPTIHRREQKGSIK